MISRDFLKAGHAPTLFAAFLYFDLSFMVWVILGPLGVAIAKDFHLDPAQKGLMVAVPVLAGAVLRLVNGVLVDRIGPKKTGMIGQLIVLAGLVLAWAIGILHGIGIGTDTTTSWGAGVTVVSVGAVTAAAVVRLSTWAHERKLAA